MDFSEAAQKQLIYGMKEIFTKEAYPCFLSFSSRFLSFPWQNIVLMYLQDPDASCVAGAAAWKAASGCSVLPDAPPILVLYPEYDPVSRSFFWAVRKVFDVRRLPLRSKKEGGSKSNADGAPDTVFGKDKAGLSGTDAAGVSGTNALHIPRAAGSTSVPGMPSSQPVLSPSQAYAAFKKAFRRETGMSVYPSDGPAKELEIAGRAVLVPQDADDRQKVILLLDQILASDVPQGELPIVKGCIDNSIRYILYSLYGFEDAERIVFPYISLPVLDEDKRAQILKRVFRTSSRLTRA